MTQIPEKMQRDLEELKRNWTTRVTTEQQDNTLLILSRDKSEFPIEDEMVSVISNMGYQIAYIDYEERKAAFELK
jgi:hypothetical protein